MKLSVAVRPGGSAIKRVWALRNDQIIWEDRTVRFGAYTYQPLTLNLEPGENKIKILAENDGAKSIPVFVTVNPSPGSGDDRPFEETVGPAVNLPDGDTAFAPPHVIPPLDGSDTASSQADAIALRKELQSQEGALFEKVTVWELLNGKANLARIRSTLLEVDAAVRDLFRWVIFRS